METRNSKSSQTQWMQISSQNYKIKIGRRNMKTKNIENSVIRTSEMIE